MIAAIHARRPGLAVYPSEHFDLKTGAAKQPPARAGVLLVFILPLIFLLASCGESYEKRSARENATRKARAQQIQMQQQQSVADLAKGYQADVTWSERPFAVTADLQERLIRADRKPIAGLAKLADVERDGGGYVLHLLFSESSLHPSLVFILRSVRSETPALDMVEFGEHFVNASDPDYAFVARISRVRRDDVLTSTTQGLDTRRRWIAEGDCLEIRKLPAEPAPPKPLRR